MLKNADWKQPHSVAIPKKLKNTFKQLEVPNYLAQILIKRGINEPREIRDFLLPSLSQLGNPFHMHGMKKCISRIQKAVKNKEQVVIYGDYDADGITATSTMYLLLKKLGANVDYFIPNRFKDHYGPNLTEYKRFIADGVSLLITVDNGIAGYDQIKYAEQHGMDVIITDHHDFPEKLPKAYTIVMSKYPHHHYYHEHDTKLIDFCGAGIAFKVAQAALGKVPKDLTDIVTLGTVADIVNLLGENRNIVDYGVQLLRQSTRPGILALAKVAGVDLTHITASQLSFNLIPRLNSLGRISDATIGVKLLTTNNIDEAAKIAKRIEDLNNKRRSIMSQQAKVASKEANSAENKKRCTLVIANRNFHPGTVGITAAYLSHKFHKPSLVVGHTDIDNKDNIDQGSGRSIEGFDLFKALDPHRSDMTTFGGHPYACGFSVKPAMIDKLRKDFEHEGLKADLPHLKTVVTPEITLAPNQIDWSVAKQIDRLQPFGAGNPDPVINVLIPKLSEIDVMGKDKSHLSAKFPVGNHQYIKVVGFGMGDLVRDLKKNPYHIEVAGCLNINHFRNRVYLQIIVQHLRHYHLGVPFRSTFAKIYRYLHAHTHVSTVNTDVITDLSKKLNINAKNVKIVVQIFEELGLVVNLKTSLYTDPKPTPCDLNDSDLYRQLNHVVN